MNNLKLFLVFFSLILLSGCFHETRYQALDHIPSDAFESTLENTKIDGLNLTTEGILVINFYDLYEGEQDLVLSYISANKTSKIEILEIKLESNLFNRIFTLHKLIEAEKQLYVFNYPNFGRPEKIYKNYFEGYTSVDDLDSEVLFEAAADGSLKAIVFYKESEETEIKEAIFPIRVKTYKNWNFPT